MGVQRSFRRGSPRAALASLSCTRAPTRDRQALHQLAEEAFLASRRARSDPPAWSSRASPPSNPLTPRPELRPSTAQSHHLDRLLAVVRSWNHLQQPAELEHARDDARGAELEHEPAVLLVCRARCSHDRMQHGGVQELGLAQVDDDLRLFAHGSGQGGRELGCARQVMFADERNDPDPFEALDSDSSRTWHPIPRFPRRQRWARTRSAAASSLLYLSIGTGEEAGAGEEAASVSIQARSCKSTHESGGWRPRRWVHP